MKAFARIAFVLVALAGCAEEGGRRGGGGGGSDVLEVQITPSKASVRVGESVAFEATPEGVEWSVEGGAENGSIDARGLYTAPDRAGSFTVIAIHPDDASVRATAAVEVLPAPSIGIEPAFATVDAGGTLEFSASVEDLDDPAVLWSVREADGGTIDDGGRYTAPTKSGSYTVVATSAADSRVFGEAKVEVRKVEVRLQPAAASLDQGGTLRLVAHVEGSVDGSVQWEVEGGDENGRVDADGLYTAPFRAGSFTVLAKSVAQPDRAAHAIIEVARPSIVLTPRDARLDQGEEIVFSASVSGTTAREVGWSVQGGDGSGTIDADGRYVAPFRAGEFKVVATNVADPSATAEATIVVATQQLAIAQPERALLQGESLQLSATLEGTIDPHVHWSVPGGSDEGSITADGLYTAPFRAGTFLVRAQSNSDPAIVRDVAIEVRQATVAISPDGVVLDQGAEIQFTARVEGTVDGAVVWTATGGTIGADGKYEATAAAGVWEVRATSLRDPSASGSVAVTVSEVEVSVSPATVELQIGESVDFVATVTGTVDPAVSWEASGGTIDASGRFTAPMEQGAFTVTARSVADPSKTATAQAVVPLAQGLTYVDPPAAGWRLVRNVAASTPQRLVLDLVGPAGGSGRGIDLALVADSSLRWSQMAPDRLVQNVAFDLGAPPHLLAGEADGATLRLGVFQKGMSAPAANYAGPLLSLALELAPGAAIPAGTPLTLTVGKANELAPAGTLAGVALQVGTLTAR